MEDINNNRNIAGNLLWSFIDNLLQKTIAIILFLLIARALTPDDIGITGIVTAIILIARAILYVGFHSALIQSKKVRPIDLSTVFYSVLVIAIFLCSFFYISAPIFGIVYKNTILIDILRVMPWVLILGAFDIINEITVSRRLWFKKTFISNFLSCAFQGFLLFYLLNNGFGIWSWVYALMARQFTYTLLLSLQIRFFPKFIFSLESFSRLWRFGSKIFIGYLIDTIFANIYKLVIGSFFDIKTLGYYNQGTLLPETVQNTANITMTNVSYPVLSSYQDDKDKREAMLKQMISISSYLIFPIMIGLVVVSEPVVLLLLTDKWLPSVPYVQILSLNLSLYPFINIFSLGINSMGRSDIGLKVELIKKAIITVILLSSLPFGIYAVLWGGVLATSLTSFYIIYLNRIYFNISVLCQIRCLLFNFLLSIAMAVTALLVTLFNLDPLLTVFIQVIVGITFYIGISTFLKLKSFLFILEHFHLSKLRL